MSEATIRSFGRAGDLGWAVMANGELYEREFGWDARYEQLIAHILGEFADSRDSDREAGWIAELDGRRVGCVFCMADDEQTARLRVLLVDPAARGHGLGARLVDTCIQHARENGFRRIVLWTNSVLSSARRIYRARGFRLIDESPHDSFGQHLVGQTWELPLSPDPHHPQ